MNYTITFDYDVWENISSSGSDYIEENEYNITSKPIKGYDTPCDTPCDNMDYIITFSYGEFVRLQEELSDYTFFFFKMPPQWIKSIVNYHVKNRNKKIVIKLSKGGKDYLAKRILSSNKFGEDEKVWIYDHVYNKVNKRRI